MEGGKGQKASYFVRAVALKNGLLPSDEVEFAYTLARRDEDQYVTEEIFQGIFRIRDYDDDNMYLVLGGKRALLIDAGMGKGDLRSLVDSLAGGLPLTVFVTHAHPDHIACLGQFQDDCPVFMHPADLPLLKRFSESRYPEIDPQKIQSVQEGYTFDLGDRQLTVYEAPGHTVGSLVLLESSGFLFSGDAFGSNRPSIPDALWMQNESCLKIDEYLVVLANFRQKVRGSIRFILNGHNDLPLAGEAYLDNLQQAAQTLVDQGAQTLVPSLRPAGIWQVVVGNRLADPHWAAINVHRDHCLTAPPDQIATLSRLELSHGRLRKPLRPGQFDYDARVDPQAVSVKVTLMPASTRCQKLTINGQEVRPGQPFPVRLRGMAERLEIVVTAPDGVTRQGYTLNIQKLGQIRM